MAIIVVPTSTPIVPTGIILPPLGPRQASIAYTIKKNSGNVARTYNPCGYTPIAQAENHPSFGVYTKIQMALDIPSVVLATDVPKPGDFFTGPDGNTYNVIARQNPSVFFCRVVGFCPILSYDLTDTVSIKPPVDSTDAYLSPLTAIGDNGAWDNIPARIQFLSNAVEDFQGIQFVRSYFYAWLNTQVSFPIGTVIEPSTGEYAGKIMRVIDNSDIENLQALERLTVTIDPV